MNFKYHGHVDILQADFKNDSWKNTTGGLTVFWLYAGSTKTSVHKQHRVIAWCIEQYKWHPWESDRSTQLLHIAAENAKAPEVDAMPQNIFAGTHPTVYPPLKNGSGDVKLGSHTIGHWNETPERRQTIFNPAKEFKLIFPHEERIVPVYVPGDAGSSMPLM